MIGLLTGTFDPVHNGHIALARAALEQCDLAAVWFLVNPDPSHKLAVASYAERLAMVELALVDQPGLVAAPVPPELAGTPHTWAQLQGLLVAWAPETFEFIVGMDTLERLDTWEDVASVVRSTSYIVADRPERGGQASATQAGVTALRQRLGELGPVLRVRTVELPPVPVSSTAVRHTAQAGGQLDVPAGVNSYITEHQLYRA